MFDQAQIEREAPRAQSGYRQVAEDIFELCELQMQLISIDSREAVSRGIKAAIFATCGIVFALTALLVLSIGAAWLIEQYTVLSTGWSMVIVAGVLLLIGGIAAFIGLRQLKHASDSLAETKSELNENVKWIKSILFQPSSPRNQMRSAPTTDRFRRVTPRV